MALFLIGALALLLGIFSAAHEDLLLLGLPSPAIDMYGLFRLGRGLILIS